MAIRFTAHLNLSPEIIARAKALLRGAPQNVHQHRVSVGLHEADASAQAINIASNKPNTNKPKRTYQGALARVKLIQVALFHEFGTARAPERSWLRSWFDTNVERHKAQMLEAMRAEYRGDKDAVARIAADWRYEIASRVSQGTAGLKPLSAQTRAERAEAGLPPGPPLYATTQLVGSFHAHVDGRQVA